MRRNPSWKLGIAALRQWLPRGREGLSPLLTGLGPFVVPCVKELVRLSPAPAGTGCPAPVGLPGSASVIPPWVELLLAECLSAYLWHRLQNNPLYLDPPPQAAIETQCPAGTNEMKWERNCPNQAKQNQILPFPLGLGAEALIAQGERTCSRQPCPQCTVFLFRQELLGVVTVRAG